MLKVLMISSDRNILAPGSGVVERMKEYAGLVGELHIVLLSDSGHGLKETELAPNLWVYPTNSAVHFLRPLGASRLGKKLIFEKQFVRGESVITADSLECGWAGLRIKNKWRIPLEVQIHNDPLSEHFSGFQNNIRKMLARKILQEADSIRVVNQGLVAGLAERFQILENKFTVLPIYIDTRKIIEGRVTFDLHDRFGWHFIMLVVARLTKEKNIPLALEALAKVRERFPDTGLVIVGTGPEEASLNKLSRELKLKHNVAFVGWQNELASYYHTANALVQTSHFEGYGLALVEAGLSGLPVITTPVGIAQELENGTEAYIYPDGDAQTLASAILDFIDRPQKREELKVNLRRTLTAKLLTKEEYLRRLKESWEATALRLQA